MFFSISFMWHFYTDLNKKAIQLVDKNILLKILESSISCIYTETI